MQEVAFNGGVLTEIHFKNIPSEIHEVKLSELLENFQIIPLETKEECLISNTMITFSEDFILVGTQNFPGTARLYRFDKSGSFIDEIGKAGRGPGENEGYVVDMINFFEDNRTILAKWNGIGDKPQLYNNNGTLLFEINQPSRFDNIRRWSESAWFSKGSLAGNPWTLRDSIALIFYNKEGEILNTIPRRSYPPHNLKEYTPTAWRPSIYNLGDQRRLYMHGNDTIFNIIDMKLVPICCDGKFCQCTPF